MRRVVYLPGIDGAFFSGDRVLEELPECETFQFAYPNDKSSDIPVMAEAVREELGRRGWDRVSLIGESYGGALAQTLTAESPSLVERTVLISTFTKHPARLYGSLVSFWLRGMPRWLLMPAAKLAARFELTRGLSPEQRKKFMERLEQVDMRGVGRRIESLKRFDARGLNLWTQPTLWVWGEGDKLVKSKDETVWVTKTRPRDTTVIIPGASHMITYAQLETLVMHVRLFLDLPSKSSRVKKVRDTDVGQ